MLVFTTYGLLLTFCLLLNNLVINSNVSPSLSSHNTLSILK